MKRMKRMKRILLNVITLYTVFYALAPRQRSTRTLIIDLEIANKNVRLSSLGELRDVKGGEERREREGVSENVPRS
jgi:hypothetical protein